MNFQKTSQFSFSFAHPAVVAPVTDLSALRRIREGGAPAGCDVLEIRADGMADDLEAVEAALGDGFPLPVLLTVRRADEGGMAPLGASERERVFLRLLRFAAAVDIELASWEELSAAVEKCRRSQLPVLASYHDFAGTPARGDLDRLATRAVEQGAAGLKIAVTTTTIDEACRLAVFTSHAAADGEIEISSMGMGRLGRLSRLMCAAAGSVLNYGYLDEPNAPGQWPAAKLQELIGDLTIR